jgi:hypothetical protein
VLKQVLFKNRAIHLFPYLSVPFWKWKRYRSKNRGRYGHPQLDKKHGNVGELRENELVVILEEVVRDFKDSVRIWNLSLGTNEECKEDCYLTEESKLWECLGFLRVNRQDTG